MSKQLQPIKLVAVETGFRDNTMVAVGQAFWFDPTPQDGDRESKLETVGGVKRRKLPKWAKPKEQAQQAIAEKAAKLRAFDTKPKAAQAAVKQKTAQLTGSDAPPADAADLA